MKILMIRHAQSSNNEIYQQLREKQSYPSPGTSKWLDMNREFERRRSSNPEISSLGVKQVDRLSSMIDSYIPPSLLPPRTSNPNNGDSGENEEQDDSDSASASSPTTTTSIGSDRKSAAGLPRLRLYVSPMLRAMLTAMPVIESLGLERKSVFCNPELYEVGGMYKEENGRFVPSEGWATAEFEKHFPGKVTFPDAMKDGWYRGHSKETLAEALKRANKVAEWLWHMAGSGSADLVILVAHADLLDLLIKSITGTHDNPLIRFFHHNTGVSMLTIASSAPAGQTRRVSIDWINRLDHLVGQNTLFSW